METDLKSSMLKLLKEDEEFRYAIVGLIGLQDLHRGQVDLKSATIKLEQSVARLEDAVARLIDEQRRTSRILRHAARYIEEVSITLEEEARSMIELRLRQRGIEIKLDALVRPYIELDIYGSNGELTVLGEMKTRSATRHIKTFEKKLSKISEHEPELIKGKIVKVIYAMWTHLDAVEEYERRKIWLNTPNKELTTPNI